MHLATRARMRRSLLLLLSAATTLALGAAGCAANPATAGASDEIVDVPQSSVKNQSISNCWLYATMGWVESLHAATGEPPVDISESYMTYWHWFDQIVYDGAPKNAIDETGYFKQGMDLIWRFGLLSEADFIPEEGAAARSSRQSSAKSKMDASLRSGALATPEARKDIVLVRRELNAAWGLSEDVIAKLAAVFGDGYERSLNQDFVLPAGTPLRRASEVRVMLASPDDPNPRAATLADAIGDRAFELGWGTRRGELAWNEHEYPRIPAEQRQFQQRIQRALHARQPVVISWFIDFAALNGRGEFRAPPERTGRQGGHVTILEDYEIENVPGFGTLKAGVLETRPEALEAALSDDARLVFLRSKNSWGSMAGPVPEFNGYLDLYMSYLQGPVKKCDTAEGATQPTCVDDHVPLWRVGLPAGF